MKTNYFFAETLKQKKDTKKPTTEKIKMNEIEANKIKNKFLDYSMSIRSRNQYNLSDETAKQIELEFSIVFSKIIDDFVDE
ncbi:hypothetical protein GQ473_01780 [archaeon]|nr:hypothetical protein [archaeon]